MKVYLCSEVVRDLGFAEQCRFARATGYDGLEVAPFTLSDEPHRLSSKAVAELRRIADGEGVAIAGLHWLLAAPAGLSITSGETGVAEKTLEVGRRLVDLCRGLGGRYLVHGSPAQRLLEPGQEEAGRKRGVAYFASVAEAAAAAGVLYIIEPLARADTAFVNSVEEAVEIIGQIGAHSLGTMVDCYAAAANGEDVPELLRQWVPAGHVRHVHFNDSNRRGPGEGSTDFSAIVDTLAQLGYSGTSAVEPFVYEPDGPSCAARAIGYLRGLADGCRWRSGQRSGVQ